MKKIKLHLLSFSYLILAGAIPTLVWFVSALAIFTRIEMEEGSFLAHMASFFITFSPFFGPLVGAPLFFKLFSKVLSNDFFRKKLWKYTLLYVPIFVVALEWYHLEFEPLWLGLGFIVFVPNGLVLATIAFLKRKSKEDE